MHARRTAQWPKRMLSILCAIALTAGVALPCAAFAGADEAEGPTALEVSDTTEPTTEQPDVTAPISEGDTADTDAETTDTDATESTDAADTDADADDEAANTTVDADTADTTTTDADKADDPQTIPSLPASAETITSAPGTWQDIPVYSYPLANGKKSLDVTVRAKLNASIAPAGSTVFATLEYGGFDDESEVTDVLNGFNTWASITLFVNGSAIDGKGFDEVEVTLLRTPISWKSIYEEPTYATASNPIYVYITDSTGTLARFIANGSPITFAPLNSGRAGATAEFTIYTGYPVKDDTTSDAGSDAANNLTVTGNTGIKASGDLQGPNIPENADIEIATSVVTSGAAFDDLNDTMGDSRISDVYEITLLVNGKEVHDGFGTLTISMPIDAQYNGHIIIIYHRHQDGSITTSHALAKDGYVTFTVTDLSSFALADGGLPEAEAEQTSNVGATLTQTGDEAPFAVLALVACLAACCMVVALRFGFKPKGQHVK